MTQIPFEHAGCDGWGVYESQYIAAEDAKNIHVAEGKFTVNSEGNRVFQVNRAARTICKEHLRPVKRALRHIHSVAEIRSMLAQLQNQCNEVCGTCVSHFYADPEP